MNFLKFTLIIGIMLPNLVFAKPQVCLDYKTYYTPENKPYIETILQFISPSLKFVANENGNLVSFVEITQIFKIGDSVIFIDKYLINSPEMKDSTIEDYFDLKRYQLDPNVYNFEIIVTDLNTNQTFFDERAITISNLTNSTINFSSIGLIQSIIKTDEQSSFVKNGFLILPYLTSIYPHDLTKIATYFEVYNSNLMFGDNEKFMITTEIENHKTGRKLEQFFKVKKYGTDKIVPVITFLPIEHLPTGDYNLIIKLIDKNNITLKTEKVYFKRITEIENPYSTSLNNFDIDKFFTNKISKDSIPFFLNSLLPITKRNDSKSIISLLESGDTLKMQDYFHSFWVQTNPLNPSEGWANYKKQVMKCETQYSSWTKHGFESDRGRVFLQYGIPNQIADETQTSTSLPYQIWHYYRIGKRSNVRFVFYNQDESSNDFILIHSEMLGELQNPNWQEVIHDRRGYNKKNPNSNKNQRDNKDIQYGGQSGRYYNN